MTYERCLHSFIQAHTAVPLRKANLDIPRLAFVLWGLVGASVAPQLLHSAMSAKPSACGCCHVLLPPQERATPPQVRSSAASENLCSCLWRNAVPGGTLCVQPLFLLNAGCSGGVFSSYLEVFGRQGLAFRAPFPLS